jgi:hypothetical protein
LCFYTQLLTNISFLVSEPVINSFEEGIQTIGKLKSNIHETEFTLLIPEVFVLAGYNFIPASFLLLSGRA